MSGHGIDDVHNLVDKLVLNVFEAMRSNTNVQEESKAQEDAIIDCHKELLQSIESIPGIDMTDDELEQRLQKALSDCSEEKRSILELNMQLTELRKKVDQKLDEVSATCSTSFHVDADMRIAGSVGAFGRNVRSQLGSFLSTILQ
jgi:chromosome segregation ATPase